MPRVDIKTIIKDLNKDELKDLISVAQGVLMAYSVLMKLRILSKKADFLKDMNVLNVNVEMLIKMENLMVDKDIFARDVDVLLMSSLYFNFQALN